MKLRNNSEKQVERRRDLQQLNRISNLFKIRQRSEFKRSLLSTVKNSSYPPCTEGIQNTSDYYVNSKDRLKLTSSNVFQSLKRKSVQFCLNQNEDEFVNNDSSQVITLGTQTSEQKQYESNEHFKIDHDYYSVPLHRCYFQELSTKMPVQILYSNNLVDDDKSVYSFATNEISGYLQHTPFSIQLEQPKNEFVNNKVLYECDYNYQNTFNKQYYIQSDSSKTYICTNSSIRRAAGGGSPIGEVSCKSPPSKVASQILHGCSEILQKCPCDFANCCCPSFEPPQQIKPKVKNNVPTQCTCQLSNKHNNQFGDNNFDKCTSSVCPTKNKPINQPNKQQNKKTNETQMGVCCTCLLSDKERKLLRKKLRQEMRAERNRQEHWSNGPFSSIIANMFAPGSKGKGGSNIIGYGIDGSPIYAPPGFTGFEDLQSLVTQTLREKEKKGKDQDSNAKNVKSTKSSEKNKDGGGEDGGDLTLGGKRGDVDKKGAEGDKKKGPTLSRKIGNCYPICPYHPNCLPKEETCPPNMGWNWAAPGKYCESTVASLPPNYTPGAVPLIIAKRIKLNRKKMLCPEDVVKRKKEAKRLS